MKFKISKLVRNCIIGVFVVGFIVFMNYFVKYYTFLNIKKHQIFDKNYALVLLYHEFKPEEGINKENQYQDVTKEKFVQDMETLKSGGYKCITLEDYVSGKYTGKKNFVITFDDGIRNNYEVAFPILKEYGYTASIFVITDKLGTGKYLTIDQLKEMENSGIIKIYSHTKTHTSAKKLTDEELLKEVNDSFKFLEDNLGGNRKAMFAYPFGHYTNHQAELLKKAGIENQFVQNYKLIHKKYVYIRRSVPNHITMERLITVR